jgi:hypothetical protein
MVEDRAAETPAVVVRATEPDRMPAPHPRAAVVRAMVVARVEATPTAVVVMVTAEANPAAARKKGAVRVNTTTNRVMTKAITDISARV